MGRYPGPFSSDRQGKFAKCIQCLCVSDPWRNGLKWGQEVIFPTNLNPVDILGDIYFDFENFHFCNVAGFQLFQIQVPIFSEIWAMPGLGRRPSGGPSGSTLSSGYPVVIYFVHL